MKNIQDEGLALRNMIQNIRVTDNICRVSSGNMKRSCGKYCICITRVENNLFKATITIAGINSGYIHL